MFFIYSNVGSTKLLKIFLHNKAIKIFEAGVYFKPFKGDIYAYNEAIKKSEAGVFVEAHH